MGAEQEAARSTSAELRDRPRHHQGEVIAVPGQDGPPATAESKAAAIAALRVGQAGAVRPADDLGIIPGRGRHGRTRERLR
jgi:hypothetical protein